MWACSSVWESNGLISRRPEVQILPCPLQKKNFFLNFNFFFWVRGIVFAEDVKTVLSLITVKFACVSLWIRGKLAISKLHFLISPQKKKGEEFIGLHFSLSRSQVSLTLLPKEPFLQGVSVSRTDVFLYLLSQRRRLLCSQVF